MPDLWSADSVGKVSRPTKAVNTIKMCDGTRRRKSCTLALTTVEQTILLQLCIFGEDAAPFIEQIWARAIILTTWEVRLLLISSELGSCAHE